MPSLWLSYLHVGLTLLVIFGSVLSILWYATRTVEEVN